MSTAINSSLTVTVISPLIIMTDRISRRHVHILRDLKLIFLCTLGSKSPSTVIKYKDEEEAVQVAARWVCQ